MSAKLTYTPPAQIEGEPEDVRELSIAQLHEALAQVFTLAEDTIVQLRAAGIGREGKEWISSEEAGAAFGLAGDLRGALDRLNRLQDAAAKPAVER